MLVIKKPGIAEQLACPVHRWKTPAWWQRNSHGNVRHTTLLPIEHFQKTSMVCSSFRRGFVGQEGILGLFRYPILEMQYK